MADEKLIFGKYKTLEEAEKGFKELESKLGQQGTQLGELTKVVEQWKPWVEKAAPIVKWYGDNNESIRGWVSGGMKTAVAGAGNGDATAAVATAARAVEAQPGSEWLTPQEKAALIQQTAEQILNTTLKPWTQNFAKSVQDYAEKAISTVNAQHRAFTDVMWRTFERTVPKDQLESLKAWHKKAIELSDPSKIDPMSLANDMLSSQGELETLRAKVKEFETAGERREKEAVPPSLFSSPSPDIASKPAEAPRTREERFSAVMDTVGKEHGTEGARQLFPSLV